jgi:hypothetical protein
MASRKTGSEHCEPGQLCVLRIGTTFMSLVGFFSRARESGDRRMEKPPTGRTISNVKTVGRRLGNPDDSPNS